MNGGNPLNVASLTPGVRSLVQLPVEGGPNQQGNVLRLTWVCRAAVCLHAARSTVACAPTFMRRTAAGLPTLWLSYRLNRNPL
jgi:hypothetical protein